MPREYPSAPIVGLGAVVWHEGKVLMIRRGQPPRQGLWSLPGGGQLLGETVEQGIRRELLEETGVEIDLLGLVAVIDSVQRDTEGRVLYHYTIIDYAARWRSGDTVAGDDAAEAAWFTPKELEELDLWEETLRVVEQSRRFLSQ
ncbi:NUDIX hydrolase [Ferrovibrio sp. MS7]|jgi:8-oxo-dGTP diphosphatase|uniref:NUDIX hydrolase n=1 Tax=Ferrovibrio plantarum TaxID=3119164 RepID=UPI001B3FC2C9|nr:NUDIX hydrolase [Ferrovibrio sp.]